MGKKIIIHVEDSGVYHAAMVIPGKNGDFVQNDGKEPNLWLREDKRYKAFIFEKRKEEK